MNNNQKQECQCTLETTAKVINAMPALRSGWEAEYCG
jgi:hypothetical protein